MPATGSSERRAEAARALAARGASVSGYVRHLGLREAAPPSAAALADLQARHLDRVVFENLEIQRGRPTTVDPAESAERIVNAGRGGYCFHLNGAFGLLLTALGYDVERRRGTVQPSAAEAHRTLNHLVLVVHGLPADGNADGGWWTEVGLADGPRVPLALRAGRTEDEPFDLTLEPSPVFAGGWRLLQDAGAEPGIVDVDAVAPAAGELAAAHERLSTSPESRFVRTVTVQRRRARHIDILRARTLSRVRRGATESRLLEDEVDWYGALTEVFGLDLSGVAAAERHALWQRAVAQHEAFAATG
jgi:arylamine N-acetyltransferase